MSIRPRTGQPNPARGGDGRRLRWSESPIPRPGVPRVRAAGAPAAAVAPTMLSYDNSYEPDEGFTTVTLTPGTITAGQVLVIWAQAYSLGGITAPSGWTTLVSGTVTNLEYLLAYKVVAGGDDLVVDFGSAAGLGRITLWKFDDDGSTALSAGTPVEATATSVALATDAGGTWAQPWNMWAAAPSDQVNGANYDYPSSQMVVDLFTFYDGALNAGWGIDTAPTPDTLDLVTYTLEAFNKPGYTIPQSCEWVTVCVGWSA